MEKQKEQSLNKPEKSQQIQWHVPQTSTKKINILCIAGMRKTKIDNEESVELLNLAIKTMKQLYSLFQFYSFYPEFFQNTIFYDKCKSPAEVNIDYVLTIGSNQTLQYTFNLFQNQDSPPIIGISCEGQSFLYNFNKCQTIQILQIFTEQVMSNKHSIFQKFPKLQIALINKQGRQTIIGHATCQLQIGRSPNPSLMKMQLFLKSHCLQSSIAFGKLWGDGILISTSLGSVCRNLSLHGPIIQKGMQNIVITPVCPLSLKFRPLCLPLNSQLIIKVDKDSRSEGNVYIDGIKSGVKIEQGEQVRIRRGKFNTILVSQLKESYEQTWIKGLTQFLAWGQQYSSGHYKQFLKNT